MPLPDLPPELRELHLRAARARRNLSTFMGEVMPSYEPEWFHAYIADKLRKFSEPGPARLMVFMPPQHGKSELVSRGFPAWYLGHNPYTQITVASYSVELARGFVKASRRFMEDAPYKAIFNTARIGYKTDQAKTDSFFEVANPTKQSHRLGSYYGIGVGGSLTGRRVDVGILDDLFKNDQEAASDRIRANVWNWYNSTFLTRLHNDSKIVACMTRWHEDDICGRILDKEGRIEEGGKWEVISLPAIKEDNDNPDDPRAIGEALWPKRHDLESLAVKRSNSERLFASLYQQRPAPEQGTIFLRDYFRVCEPASVPSGPVHLAIDTAYTSKSENDPTGILAFSVVDGIIYVKDFKAVRLEFPELVKFLPEYAKQVGCDNGSRLYIEPKASGQSVAQQLRRDTTLGVIETKAPDTDKQVRGRATANEMETGRVVFVKGSYLDSFKQQLLMFPNAKHDEEVDCLGIALEGRKKLGNYRIALV